MIAGIILLLVLWAFTLWIIWQPYAFSQIPTVKGSWCDGGKCWESVNGRKVRL